MNKSKSRKFWFRCLKTFLKIFIRKPKFVYLGESIKQTSIIISNHVGAFGPLKTELYLDVPFRFWGTYEMNSNFKSVYRYLSYDYFHIRQHWNLFLSRLFCIIAAPLVKWFYSGLRLISTYPDSRFKTTIKKSMEVIENGESIVLFPEDSETGYFDNLKRYFAGFAVLAKTALKKGIDLPIYLAYLRRRDNTYVFDKPLLASKLLSSGKSKYEIAEELCNRANELGLMELEKA